MLALDEDQRPKERPEVAQEREDGQRDHARAGHRHDDVPEDLPVTGPVDAGGLVQAGRYRQHELPQQERAECAERSRDYQPGVGVQQAELDHDRVVGDHRHDAGDHHRGQVELEDRVPPAPLDPREGVGGHRAGDALQERDPGGHEEAVEVVSPERDLLEDLRVVADSPGGGNGVDALDFGHRLEAGQHHPREGREHCQGQQDQQRVPDAEASAAAPPAPAVGGMYLVNMAHARVPSRSRDASRTSSSPASRQR